MDVDHVVLWVDDPAKALEFYVEVLGFRAVRAEAYRDGQAPFPSVRLSPTTILDLMARSDAPGVASFTGGPASGGAINHVCFTTSAENHATLKARLQQTGVKMTSAGKGAFGARGTTDHSFYFNDPDGNVLELRYYE